MRQFWNDRYAQKEYVYGALPNVYFKSVIDTLPPGNVLIPGAGEGRDAVYAAKLGWSVDAFDFSAEGKKKALRLAEMEKVNIHFEVTDAEEFDPGAKRYDLIALIYFHLPLPVRQAFHRKVCTWLRPGGHVILEAFHPSQLSNASGGPRDVSMLMTPEQLRSEFAALQEIENKALQITLDEGTFHCGNAGIVRYHGHTI